MEAHTVDLHMVDLHIAAADHTLQQKHTLMISQPYASLALGF